MSDASLRVSGLTKRFGGITAVDGVDLEAKPGEVVAVIGQNGAGKSTLLGTISGALKPTSGQISLGGVDITGKSTDWACRAGLSRTFQIPRPFADLTVEQNIAVAAEYGGRPRPSERVSVDQILAFCELTHCRTARASELGHGDHRRIEFARSIATSPKVVLLDELGAGLSEIEIQAFGGLVRRLADRGVAVVFVEHVMSLVLAIADRVIVMEAGRKIADGELQAVMRDPVVLRSYLGVDEGEDADALD